MKFIVKVTARIDADDSDQADALAARIAYTTAALEEVGVVIVSLYEDAEDAEEPTLEEQAMWN